MDIKQLSRSRVAVLLGFAVGLLLLTSCGAVLVASTALPGCASCHFDEPGFEKATRAVTHGQVPCVSCHVQTESVLARTKFGVYEAFGMWVPLMDASSSDVAAVNDGQCLSCHRDVNAKTIEARGVRIKHSSCAVENECVDCHSEVGHGQATTWPRVASMNDCVTCHKRTKNTVACAACHTGKVESLNFSKPEFAVTHGPTWKDTHGMGQMSACSVCHQEGSCSKCHGPGVPHTADFIRDHPEVSTLPDAECTTCHRKVFCDTCHGTEMPHPKKFAAQHSKIVRRDGEPPCLRCHSKKDCDGCHIKHVHPGGAVGLIPAPSRDGN